VGGGTTRSTYVAATAKLPLLQSTGVFNEASI
jgi:hypothetical protein